MKAHSFILCLALIVNIAACDNTSKEATTNNKETPPPVDFSLVDLDGNIRSLKEWEGKFIVLNFWATWCPPCRTEIPSFIKLQQKHADAGLQFVGIAIDNEVSVQQFSMQMNINYPILIAQTQGIELARQYGNLSGALPFSVLINPEGVIVARHVGILEPEEIIETAQLAND